MKLKWWMRVVGAFYLLLFFLVTFLKLPIKVEGPPGALNLAMLGDPLANFLIDIWVTFGLELGVLGGALLWFSRKPQEAKALVGVVILGELVRGIGVDFYKMARGYEVQGLLIWIVIHSIIIVTGLYALQVLKLGKK